MPAESDEDEGELISWERSPRCRSLSVKKSSPKSARISHLLKEKAKKKSDHSRFKHGFNPFAIKPPIHNPLSADGSVDGTQSVPQARHVPDLLSLRRPCERGEASFTGQGKCKASGASGAAVRDASAAASESSYATVQSLFMKQKVSSSDFS